MHRRRRARRGGMGRFGRRRPRAGDAVPGSPALCGVNGCRPVAWRARAGVKHGAQASGAGRGGAARATGWRTGRWRVRARVRACVRARRRGGAGAARVRRVWHARVRGPGQGARSSGSREGSTGAGQVRRGKWSWWRSGEKGAGHGVLGRRGEGGVPSARGRREKREERGKEKKENGKREMEGEKERERERDSRRHRRSVGHARRLGTHECDARVEEETGCEIRVSGQVFRGSEDRNRDVPGKLGLGF